VTAGLPLRGKACIGRVFHLSLDPSEESVLRRTADDPDRSPAHLMNDLHLLRAKRSPWSARVDNSTLTPLETLQKIADLVQSGEGEIHGLLADTY
jgi:hypothetical protein